MAPEAVWRLRLDRREQAPMDWLFASEAAARDVRDRILSISRGTSRVSVYGQSWYTVLLIDHVEVLVSDRAGWSVERVWVKVDVSVYSDVRMNP